MTTSYTHPLNRRVGRYPKVARLGLGYKTPLTIDATVIYQGEKCLRIGDLWVFEHDGGFVEITEQTQIDILEQWYQSNVSPKSSPPSVKPNGSRLGTNKV